VFQTLATANFYTHFINSITVLENLPPDGGLQKRATFSTLNVVKFALQLDPDNVDEPTEMTPDGDSTGNAYTVTEEEELNLSLTVTNNAVPLGPPCGSADNVGDICSFIARDGIHQIVR
jgi:hypothetical protein